MNQRRRDNLMDISDKLVQADTDLDVLEAIKSEEIAYLTAPDHDSRMNSLERVERGIVELKERGFCNDYSDFMRKRINEWYDESMIPFNNREHSFQLIKAKASLSGITQRPEAFPFMIEYFKKQFPNDCINVYTDELAERIHTESIRSSVLEYMAPLINRKEHKTNSKISVPADTIYMAGERFINTMRENEYSNLFNKMKKNYQNINKYGI
ncbi:MAG: hypothetical protein ACOCZV_01585 [Nanoarchaeota archaeon]